MRFLTKLIVLFFAASLFLACAQQEPEKEKTGIEKMKEDVKGVTDQLGEEWKKLMGKEKKGMEKALDDLAAELEKLEPGDEKRQRLQEKIDKLKASLKEAGEGTKADWQQFKEDFKATTQDISQDVNQVVSPEN